MNRHHLFKKPYKCQNCVKSFTTIGQLRRHEKYVHDKSNGARPFECSVCSKRFVEKCKLMRHFPVHQRKKQRKLEKEENRGIVKKEAKEEMIDVRPKRSSV